MSSINRGMVRTHNKAIYIEHILWPSNLCENWELTSLTNIFWNSEDYSMFLEFGFKLPVSWRLFWKPQFNLSDSIGSLQYFIICICLQDLYHGGRGHQSSQQCKDTCAPVQYTYCTVKHVHTCSIVQYIEPCRWQSCCIFATFAYPPLVWPTVGTLMPFCWKWRMRGLDVRSELLSNSGNIIICTSTYQFTKMVQAR